MLNVWLLDKCIAYAKAHRHPEQAGQMIWQMFEAERSKLVPYAGPFDGFHSVPASVSKTWTVRFDNKKYSVISTTVGRPVEVHAYADRIVIRQDGNLVIGFQVDTGAIVGDRRCCCAVVHEQPQRQELRRGGQIGSDLLFEDRA
jgi:hypothetical protein